MSAVFVTGAGTDVGKTFVTCGLLRHLRARGRAVAALKPVVSGFDLANPDGSDSALLLAALGTAATREALAAISPWQFRAALSPDMAARREGRAIDVDAVIAHSRAAIAATPGASLLAIEGVGGVRVPLDDARTVAEWIDALALPVVLVCGTYLGALSHALTAFEVLHGRGREVACLVASESAASPVPLDETCATLRRFAGATPIVGLPRGATPGDAAFAAIASTLP